MSINSSGRLAIFLNGGNLYGTTQIDDGNWHHVAVVMPENAQANFPNALQLLFKISFTKDRTIIFQALIIHRIALDVEFLNNRGRPLTELHGLFGVNFVTNGNDGSEVVVLGMSRPVIILHRLI